MDKAAVLPPPGPNAELVAWTLFALKVTGWAAVFLLIALFGWAASSLHVLAGWSGGLVQRLEILKGLLASIASGGIVGALGFYSETPVLLTLIGVFCAGFAGERYLKPLVEAVLQRALGWVPGAK